MHFGRAILRDTSGENNLTHGIKRVDEPYVGPDGNETFKIFGRRNRPFRVQSPYCAFDFNANSDTQVALINSNGRELVEELSKEGYEEFQDFLFAVGYRGLEHQCGAGLWIRYMTKYQCKGPKDSKHAKKMREEITDTYCNDERSVDKTVRRLIGKHMNEITNGMSIPKDQAVFCLGGGLLKRSDIGSIMKCSINMIPLEDLHVALGAEPPETNAGPFNWSNIVSRYNKRTNTLEEINLYMWCVHYFKEGKKIIPQFMGYNSENPKWPIDEKYAKYTLALFKPWRDRVVEGEIDVLRHTTGGLRPNPLR